LSPGGETSYFCERHPARRTGALLTRVQAQAARLSDTVALFQALGAGWSSRGGREAADTTTQTLERRQ